MWNHKQKRATSFLYGKFIKPKLNKFLKVMTISRRIVIQTREISMYLKIMDQYYCSKNVNNLEKITLYLDDKHDEFINFWTVFFQLCKMLVFCSV